MSKILLTAAGAAGFLLGSRAGRAPYESFLSQVQRLRDDPEVRRRAAEVGESVTDSVTDAAAAAKTKVDQVTTGPGTATP